MVDDKPGMGKRREGRRKRSKEKNGEVVRELSSTKPQERWINKVNDEASELPTDDNADKANKKRMKVTTEKCGNKVDSDQRLSGENGRMLGRKRMSKAASESTGLKVENVRKTSYAEIARKNIRENNMGEIRKINKQEMENKGTQKREHEMRQRRKYMNNSEPGNMTNRNRNVGRRNRTIKLSEWCQDIIKMKAIKQREVRRNNMYLKQINKNKSKRGKNNVKLLSERLQKE